MSLPSNIVSFPADRGDLVAHPLADLFPLIESKEFDDLVASIREDGLIDAIVLFDGQILDGRNRYRACRAAGAPPRFEQFTGTNPAKYVAAKNIHRRNLTTNERAIIAAKMAGLSRGSNRFQRKSQDIEVVSATSTISLQEAADLLGVERATVANAKLVLDHGSELDIASLRKGAGIRPMADKIRAAMTPEEKAAQQRKGAEKMIAINRGDADLRRKRQMHADLWDQLKAALDALTGLPLPSDVVRIVNANVARARFADEKQASAAAWLNEFSNLWSSRNG